MLFLRIGSTSVAHFHLRRFASLAHELRWADPAFPIRQPALVRWRRTGKLRILLFLMPPTINLTATPCRKSSALMNEPSEIPPGALANDFAAFCA